MLELYSPEGFRSDGRRWNELRFCRLKMNTHSKSADGSATVEMGGTKVVCMVQGPHEPEGRGATDRLTLSVSVSVAPFSGQVRDKRPTNDRRLQEIGLRVEQLLEQAILVKLSPRTQVSLQIIVLAQDGGILPAIVNAATLGLIDAGVPMTEYIASCGVCLYDQSPLLDPSHLEEQDLPGVSVAIVGKERKMAMLIVDQRVGLDRLRPALDLAIEGCLSVRNLLDEEVRRHGAERLQRLAN